MKLVGLTGGIACGKSTVASMLREAGLPVIDCDQIAHDVQKKASLVACTELYHHLHATGAVGIPSNGQRIWPQCLPPRRRD